MLAYLAASSSSNQPQPSKTVVAQTFLGAKGHPARGAANRLCGVRLRTWFSHATKPRYRAALRPPKPPAPTSRWGDQSRFQTTANPEARFSAVPPQTAWRRTRSSSATEIAADREWSELRRT